MSEHLVSEFREELYRIADWWDENGVDEAEGGFIGEINTAYRRIPEANKGIVLNARILWFFSGLCVFAGSDKYRHLADRAYLYIQEYFVDRVHGGVFWEVDFQGKCTNDRKQVYAQAFAIYGLSAYYRLTGDSAVLALAMQLFELIENSHDEKFKGYIEAFDGQWGALEDMRLSEKDLNAPKTMNTHLHILEAYTALYVASPSDTIKASIQRCLGFFYDHIISHESGHLRMFQDYDWTDLSDTYSFGHDIESSWLILEAIKAIGDEALLEKFQPLVLAMVDTVLRDGLGEEGEVHDAFNFKTSTMTEERVWWVQAEALVGFYTAYDLTSDKKYLNAFENVWGFIKRYQLDKSGGDWHWLSLKDRPNQGDCVMGFWKGPYHNGRAMMEICKLISKNC